VPQDTLVKLTNRRATLVLIEDSDLPDKINELLKYRRPGWEYTPQGALWLYNTTNKITDENGNTPGWDGYTKLVSADGMMSTGVFLAMREKLEEKLNLHFVVQDRRVAPKLGGKADFVPDDGKEERAYQTSCVKAMLKGNRTGGLVLNATGTGKTFIAGMYLGNTAGNGLFLVDELTLLKQAKKELEEVLNEEVGEIGNSVWNTKRITVGTIQTVHRHRFDKQYVPWTRTLDCLVIDEVHLALNRRNFETIRAIKPPTIFGLTATLELQKKHIALRAYELCGPVLYDYPLKRGVEEGVLSKGVAIAVQVRNEDNDTYEGDGNWMHRRRYYRERYPEQYRKFIVDGEQRNKTIVNLVNEGYFKGKHIVVLLERVKHLHNISHMLKIPHHLVYGAKTVSERRDSQDLFEREKVRVILANKVFKKGINIKRIDILIDGAAMKSKNDAQQKYGRGVRLCEGKNGLIYFDISDIGNRFEKAAKSRRAALKKNGVPVYLADISLGISRIYELAEKRLFEIDKDTNSRQEELFKHSGKH
jgi:superfamily II DNA or RNA helicase